MYSMNQKTSTESLRFAPIALAVVLLAILALLALHVHAEEDVAVPEQTSLQDRVQEQRDLFKEVRDERQEVFQENQNELQIMREEGATSEELEAQRLEQRAEMQLMVDMQRGEMLQNREEVRAMLQEKKDALEGRIQERKETRAQMQTERKAKLGLEMQVRLGQYVERIVERMSTAVDRLEQITERVDLRIKKLEENGVNLSEANEKLHTITPLIADAREYITLISKVSIDILTSENPREESSEVREAVMLAKEGIKTIHTALSETVQLIKASVQVPAPEEEVTEENESADEEAVAE